MSVNGISAANSNSYYFSALSSGKKQPTAAAGASETAILQKQERITRGLDAGTVYLTSAKSAANISDGALGNVADYLQRIDELAIRMSNGLMSDSDRSIYQNEINQMADGISDIISNTKYNETSLLNGGDVSLATDVTGGLAQLGLTDLPELLKSLKEGNFDLDKIEETLSKVSEGRSKVGAQSNGFDYAMSVNRRSAYDLTASSSRMGDTEYGEYVSKLKQNQGLQNYRNIMQRKNMENQQRTANNWFANM
ncbi:MAG: flagellin FliC5 [Lachnospiraceae bacterium]|nr:flagellin FliC5 [Lachnospiraceae bacterium]